MARDGATGLRKVDPAVSARGTGQAHDGQRGPGERVRVMDLRQQPAAESPAKTLVVITHDSGGAENAWLTQRPIRRPFETTTDRGTPCGWRPSLRGQPLLRHTRACGGRVAGGRCRIVRAAVNRARSPGRGVPRCLARAVPPSVATEESDGAPGRGCPVGDRVWTGSWDRTSDGPPGAVAVWP